MFGNNFFAIFVAFGKTSLTEEFFNLITTDFLTPLSSIAFIIFEIERSVLGVAVIANTLLPLKDIIFASL